MIWLALEFSSDRRSVAVFQDGDVFEAVHCGTVETPIFGLVRKALESAGLARGELQALAVGIGPGSYTGVRLALAVAQGWTLATGIPVAGINSLECLAQVAAIAAEPTLLAVDAQRGEFATALAASGRLVEPIRLQTLAQLQQRSAEGLRIVGPEIARQLPGAVEAFPTSSALVRLATHNPVFGPAEKLVPIYLREANFIKAPPPRFRITPGATTADPLL